jgi:hypothetical protein
MPQAASVPGLSRTHRVITALVSLVTGLLTAVLAVRVWG